MSDIFIKEVINGRVIEIEILKVKHMMFMTPEEQQYPPEQKAVLLLSRIVKINGERLTFDELMESDDIAAYTFMMETLAEMTTKRTML